MNELTNEPLVYSSREEFLRDFKEHMLEHQTKLQTFRQQILNPDSASFKLGHTQRQALESNADKKALGLEMSLYMAQHLEFKDKYYPQESFVLAGVEFNFRDYFDKNGNIVVPNFEIIESV